MLNKLKIKPEGKSITFKMVPGTMRSRLLAIQGLHWEGPLFPSSRHIPSTYREEGHGVCPFLPRPCTEYLGYQNSRANQPQGRAGSTWAFFPDQISRCGYTGTACIIGGGHYRVCKGCLGLGCVCRWVPVHVHEAPHSAGGDMMEVERKSGLYWISCPKPSNYRVGPSWHRQQRLLL